MGKPIETGRFVLHDRHPEHGVGRVLSVGAFATHVLFVRGGLRVFRVAEADTSLSVSAAPSAEDLAILVEKEASMTRGVIESPASDTKPAKKKKKAKAATADA